MSSKRSPQFWQRLLAAELPVLKAAEVAESLRNDPDPERRLLAHPKLGPSANGANMAALESALAQGAYIVESDDYPDWAQGTASTPPALFAWGDFGCLHRPCVAIVGTRSASTYGRAVAQKFAEALARAGVTVVSGGATGVDAAAHKGALEAGGQTAAVLLTSIDRTYPAVHDGLFRRIRENGVLISQFSAGKDSTREVRPLWRNRSIALLSNAVLVVEAPERSGALSTASAANELGRQVFVVPANIDNLNFRGSHALIRDGATLVDHPGALLQALNVQEVPELPMASLPPIHAKILDVLSTDPLATEFIAERTGLDLSTLMSELTLLEMDGRVLRDGGGYALRP